MTFAQDDLDPTAENEDNYEGLLVSIEASEGILSLLIAVCDDSNFRDRIIERYEAEVQPDIRPYRVELPRGEPSMRAAIAKLVQEDEYLKNGGRAVITVTGAEKLFFLKLGAERSEQEIFFGYLQWTREGLREFRYPIVLWVTNQILVELIKKAPDFWSWRKGVFHFRSKKTNAISSAEVPLLSLFINDSNLRDENPYFLPLEDLQQLIQQIEQQKGIEDPSLATLYSRMGQIYQRRLEQAEYQNYKQEEELAVEYFIKAVELQEKLGLDTELGNSLNSLAILYSSQENYSQAEPLFQQALVLAQLSSGEEHSDVATSLNNLALLYESQERYSEAKALFEEALDLSKRLLGDKNLLVATILGNLACLYHYQGHYSQAESLCVQALELNQSLLGNEHPDVAIRLNNLATLCMAQRRYREAESLLEQALDISKYLLGEEHPLVATILNNLGNLYKVQGFYSEAEAFYMQALVIRKHLFGEKHPDVAASMTNLAYVYKYQERYSEAESLYVQALALREKLFGKEHSDVAASLNNLATLYGLQSRYTEAEPLFIQALEMSEKILGNNHPQTATILVNLRGMREEMYKHSSSVSTVSAKS